MVQIQQLQIMNGNVINIHLSDELDVEFMEVLETVRKNARLSYWEVMDTPDGVVKMDKNGLLTVFSVRIIR